jgi:hypothetical protein
VRPLGPVDRRRGRRYRGSWRQTPIAGQLELAHPMRLQAMAAPDALVALRPMSRYGAVLSGPAMTGAVSGGSIVDGTEAQAAMPKAMTRVRRLLPRTSVFIGARRRASERISVTMRSPRRLSAASLFRTAPKERWTSVQYLSAGGIDHECLHFRRGCGQCEIGGGFGACGDRVVARPRATDKEPPGFFGVLRSHVAISLSAAQGPEPPMTSAARHARYSRFVS